MGATPAISQRAVAGPIGTIARKYEPVTFQLRLQAGAVPVSVMLQEFQGSTCDDGRQLRATPTWVAATKSSSTVISRSPTGTSTGRKGIGTKFHAPDLWT